MQFEAGPISQLMIVAYYTKLLIPTGTLCRNDVKGNFTVTVVAHVVAFDVNSYLTA